MNYCEVCGDETRYITCAPCKRKEREYSQFIHLCDSERMKSFSLEKLKIKSWSGVENRILRECFVKILDTLTEREEAVIKELFGFEDGEFKTLECAGKKFYVSRSRIAQIRDLSIRKMRHPSRSRNLESFYGKGGYWYIEFFGNYWIPNPAMSYAEANNLPNLYQNALDRKEAQLKREEEERQRETRAKMRSEQRERDELQREEWQRLAIERQEKEELERRERHKAKIDLMMQAQKSYREKVVERFLEKLPRKEELMHLWFTHTPECKAYKQGVATFYVADLVTGINSMLIAYEQNIGEKELPCLLYPLHEKWDLFVKLYSSYINKGGLQNLTHAFQCFDTILKTYADFKNVSSDMTKWFFRLCGAWNDYEVYKIFKMTEGEVKC